MINHKDTDRTLAWQVVFAVTLLLISAAEASAQSVPVRSAGGTPNGYQLPPLSPEDYLYALEESGMSAAKAAEYSEANHEALLGLPPVWTPIGPTGNAPPGNGRITAIQIVPTGGTSYDIYAGAPTGGLWRRASTLTAWTPIGDRLPNIAIGSVSVHPTAWTTIVVGTGSLAFRGGSGIYWTDNGGTSWNAATYAAGIPIPARVPSLARDPGTPTTLIAATNVGVLRSTDGGHHWTRQLVGDVTDLVVDPGNFQTQYSVMVNANAGVYKSTSGGTTWPTHFDHSTDADIPASADLNLGRLAICRDFPSTVVLQVVNLFGAISPPGVKGLRTTDGGTSWAVIKDSVGADQLDHANGIAIRPNNANEVYFGTIILERTTNANASTPTWTPVNGGHPDMKQLYFHSTPGDNQLWIANDGGLYTYTVGGATTNWNGDTTLGLRVSQAYYLDAETSMVVVGLQDNGVFRTVDFGATWTSIGGGDGFNAEITDNRAFETYIVSGGCPGCCNNGLTRVPFAGGGSVVLTDVCSASIWYDRINSRFYATTYNGSANTLLSQAMPATNPSGWSTDVTFPVGLGIREFQGSYLDATIYSNAWNGTLLVSRWNGSSFTTSTRTMGAGLIVQYVHPSMERLGEAWVGVQSGVGQPKLFHTTDYAVTVTDISGSLSSVGRVGSIVISPFHREEVYVGTDVGVFRSLDGGASWSPFQDGMPVVGIWDLDYVKRTDGTDSLVAATWGRGVWERTIQSTPIVYVDDRNVSFEDGTLEHPFNTFKEGKTSVWPGGILALHGAYYVGAPVTIDTPMTINAYESPATIGK